MDWIFNHLQLVIAIAGVVAWWLSQSKKAGSAEDTEAGGKTFADPELAERTRRIREEIQRKIDQRSRGYTAPQTRPVPQSPPELAGLPPILRELVQMSQPEPPPPPRASDVDLQAERNAEILEKQAAMMEQLRLAKEMEETRQRRTQFETEVGSKEELAKVAVRNALGDDLRDPAALRRAFVLREILGPPVALRP